MPGRGRRPRTGGGRSIHASALGARGRAAGGGLRRRLVRRLTAALPALWAVAPVVPRSRGDGVVLRPVLDGVRLATDGGGAGAGARRVGDGAAGEPGAQPDRQ